MVRAHIFVHKVGGMCVCACECSCVMYKREEDPEEIKCSLNCVLNGYYLDIKWCAVCKRAHNVLCSKYKHTIFFFLCHECICMEFRFFIFFILLSHKYAIFHWNMMKSIGFNLIFIRFGLNRLRMLNRLIFFPKNSICGFYRENTNQLVSIWMSINQPLYLETLWA